MSIHTFDSERLKDQGEHFLEKLERELLDLGMAVEFLECDHLCFRVATTEQYFFYKLEFEKLGKLLTEATVNGRAISTFLLTSPFQTNHHKVPLLELPAPKTGSDYETGFEHGEFVINETFEAFRLKFPHLSFSESGQQGLNPELCLKLKKGVQAKFHHLSLQRVIELEKAED
jgi:predicted metalloenzyme YecM